MIREPRPAGRRPMWMRTVVDDSWWARSFVRVVVVTAALAMVVTPTSASAESEESCGCPSMSPAAVLDRADVAVDAVATAVERVNARVSVVTYEVAGVWKGDAPASIEVVVDDEQRFFGAGVCESWGSPFVGLFSDASGLVGLRVDGDLLIADPCQLQLDRELVAAALEPPEPTSNSPARYVHLGPIGSANVTALDTHAEVVATARVVGVPFALRACDAGTVALLVEDDDRMLSVVRFDTIAWREVDRMSTGLRGPAAGGISCLDDLRVFVPAGGVDPTHVEVDFARRSVEPVVLAGGAFVRTSGDVMAWVEERASEKAVGERVTEVVVADAAGSEVARAPIERDDASVIRAAAFDGDGRFGVVVDYVGVSIDRATEVHEFDFDGSDAVLVGVVEVGVPADRATARSLLRYGFDDLLDGIGIDELVDRVTDASGAALGSAGRPFDGVALDGGLVLAATRFGPVIVDAEGNAQTFLDRFPPAGADWSVSGRASVVELASLTPIAGSPSVSVASMQPVGGAAVDVGPLDPDELRRRFPMPEQPATETESRANRSALVVGALVAGVAAAVVGLRRRRL